MKVLVIGGGGREHALAWKLAQSPKVQAVYVAPGNGGTALDSRLENVPITDLRQLRDWALKQKIALTVVGPEAPLAAGVVDDFRAHGLRIFGPTQAAAQLELQGLLQGLHGAPQDPDGGVRDLQRRRAGPRLRGPQGRPIVVKADGLAAGKGVVVAMTRPKPMKPIDFMLLDNKLGVSAQRRRRAVIEEFLQGEEASFIVLCDGKNVTALATSQDHKRLLDGDQGPNTGGMGAYSPAPVVTPAVHAKAMREIIMPTMRGMEKDGIPYTGFLYAGLMIEDGTPRRWNSTAAWATGDPADHDAAEVRPVRRDAGRHLRRPGPGGAGLGPPRRAGRRGGRAGYPMDPRKGDVIEGLARSTEGRHGVPGGTAAQDGHTVTTGGRVLCVTALASTVKAAQMHAYDLLKGISFDGAQYRRDIGHRAVKG